MLLETLVDGMRQLQGSDSVAMSPDNAVASVDLLALTVRWYAARVTLKRRL